MAYTSSGLALTAQRVGGGGAVWNYASTDVHTDVDATGYFTDGNARGMKVGDVVHVIETDNSYAQTTHSVTISTANGAATISAAT